MDPNNNNLNNEVNLECGILLQVTFFTKLLLNFCFLMHTKILFYFITKITVKKEGDWGSSGGGGGRPMGGGMVEQNNHMRGWGGGDSGNMGGGGRNSMD